MRIRKRIEQSPQFFSFARIGMAFEMNRIIFMALPLCVVGLSSPVEAEAVKETVKANKREVGVTWVVL